MSIPCIPHRVMMIAEANSFWTKKYIEHISLPIGQSVILLSPTNTTYADFYKANDVKVVLTKGSGILDRIPGVRSKQRCFRTKAIIESADVDVILVNYCFPSVLKTLASCNCQVPYILVYWGSDLLRATKKEHHNSAKAVNHAKRIVVMTKYMQKYVAECCGEEVLKKTSVIDMGVSALSSIEALFPDLEKIKKEFTHSENKTVIAIAYNADINQQHLKIIEQMSKLSSEVKKKIILLIPMTYRRLDSEYIAKVKMAANESGIKTIVPETFMDDTEIAKMCLSSDIFINAQITDAQSTSMLEHLYAGTEIVNGSWLVYPYFDENGIKCQTFTRFEELKDIVLAYLAGKRVSSAKDWRGLLNRDYSWEICRKKWQKLFESL